MRRQGPSLRRLARRFSAMTGPENPSICALLDLLRSDFETVLHVTATTHRAPSALATVAIRTYCVIVENFSPVVQIVAMKSASQFQVQRRHTFQRRQS